MYLQTLKPYRKPGSIHNEIDNLLHEFYGGPIHTGALAGEWLPAADITETEDRVFIKAELPGIEEKDIDLSICGNMLTIRDEKKHMKEEKDENHCFGDRYYGSFGRTFELSEDVDENRAEAKFSRDVLKITIPRIKEGKRKKIEINGK